MKNIYLYGASDDCHEVETDFDAGFEGYEDVMLNNIKVHYEYDGDWRIDILGDVPNTWKVKKILGTSEFIHIQVPDDEVITYERVKEK